MPPSWTELSLGARPPPREVEDFEPGWRCWGWQHEAASRVEHQHREIDILEIVAEGLPLFGGVQLVVDTTLVSPLRGEGSPRPNAAVRDGVALQVARRRKERTHPELVGRVRVLGWSSGLEKLGCWSGETLTCLRLLAEAKSRSEPPLLRRRAEMAWRLRWTHVVLCCRKGLRGLFVGASPQWRGRW